MAEKRHYQIRQAILADLDAAYPAGRGIGDLSRWPNCEALATTRGELMDEARFLERHGLIVDVRAGREPYWKITAPGMSQIRRETALVEIVWGERAL
jgi:hypothetical protein